MIKWFNDTFKGFRTFLLAALVAALATLQATDILPLLPDGWQRWGVVLIPVVFAALRAVTTTPPGNSKET